MKKRTPPHMPEPKWQGKDWKRALDLARSAPRCKARCKHSKLPCKGPAVKGWTVCRKHGARGGGRTGEANANYRHGRCTQEAKAERQRLRSLRVSTAALIRAIREAG
jgi:hypothetical protein